MKNISKKIGHGELGPLIYAHFSDFGVILKVGNLA